MLSTIILLGSLTFYYPIKRHAVSKKFPVMNSKIIKTERLNYKSLYNFHIDSMFIVNQGMLSLKGALDLVHGNQNRQVELWSACFISKFF